MKLKEYKQFLLGNNYKYKKDDLNGYSWMIYFIDDCKDKDESKILPDKIISFFIETDKTLNKVLDKEMLTCDYLEFESLKDKKVEDIKFLKHSIDE